MQNWKKRSKHRSVITLPVHCEKTYSGSKTGSVDCDAKSGRWGQAEEFGGESVVGAGDGEEWKGQKVMNEKEVRLRCC